jgi:1-acyl-sn-glycerol-3-phosphate acyltransferase
MNPIFRFFFILFGWKVEGKVPSDVKKAIFAVCPHWYNSDFLIGLGTRAVMDREVGYLGKAELFKPPFGFIFKALGGIPVIRHKNLNLVESMVDAVKKSDDKLICLAPEGTRSNVSKLKSGFYYIALGAEIPIIMVGFDWENKQAVIAEPFQSSGDFEADMQKYFVPFFEKIGGKQKDWIQNYKEGKFS